MPSADAAARTRESAGNPMPQDFEHFERRLTEESSQLRLEMAELRTEMRGELGAIRTEMATALGGMRTGMAGIRTEIAQNTFELLKWAFVFWVGQLVGVAGIVGLLLRMMPAR